MSAQPRIIEVRQNTLKRNDVLAQKLRQRFQDAGVFVVSLVSSPGSGKTAFLEKTLTLLKQRQYRPAALVGDLATDNDAARLARSQAPVKQITTGRLCHLEAAMIESALENWDLEELDFLFIENVGNLVCPSSYDLGENLRLVLLSVTEGEDKPLKSPRPSNLTGRPWRPTSNPFVRACQCCECRPRQARAWTSGLLLYLRPVIDKCLHFLWVLLRDDIGPALRSDLKTVDPVECWNEADLILRSPRTLVPSHSSKALLWSFDRQRKPANRA
jgi:hydrogenase accessory protein HypB